MSFDYDLFVIGGGSGGVRAARVASATGAKVALAEESRMGGTCVIRGCVPKKLMVFASGYGETIGEARDYGWDAELGNFNWQPFHGKLTAELDRLEGIYQKLLENSGVTSFHSRAVLKDPHTVALADGTEVSAKHILIATGGRPVKPGLKNEELGMVSDDLFHLDALPEDILIVGAGYIACEFACILHNLGVKVAMYIRGETILRGFDGEARDLVAEMMTKRGIEMHMGTSISQMARNSEGGIKITASDGTARVFSSVLFATGRKANTKDLGLETCAIEMSANGAIKVDAYSQTSQPSVFAIGDVTGRVELTPVAIREGMAFVETVFKGNPTPVDHELIPSAVFTQPELGTVGLTEEEAFKLEPVDIYRTSFRPMQHAFIDRPDKVLMKLVVSKATERVLGCHIVAPGAGEMIQLAGIAVKMGATKAQFDQVCAVHPTMTEELVTMKEPSRSS